MRQSICFRWCVLGVALLFIGCGSGGSTCTVSGKVTAKGKPVYTGVISFYGANGDFVSGGIDTEGNYKVLEAPKGVMKVAVVSNKPAAGAPHARKNENSGPAVQAPPPPDPSKWFAIDAKYSDPATSGIEVTLSGGSNTKDIALE